MANHIYVTAIGTHLDRARQFVEALASRNLDVIADQSAGGITDSDLEFAASCIVLAWGGLQYEYEPHEIYPSVRSALPVVIAKLDHSARLPDESQGISVFDLGSWYGGDHPELTRLVHVLQRSSGYRLSKSWGSSLSVGMVGRAESAVTDVEKLISAVHRLDGVLSEESAQARAVGDTLRELGETYRVVKSAIEKFFSAGLAPNGIDGQAYAFLERGTLAEAVHNGRAHCLRIGARYYQEGGIRQALKGRASPDFLADADATFEELTNSDHDMLAAMDSIGEALTTESRAIVVDLLSDREDAAREKIVRARNLLLPLEEKLDDALAIFKAIEATLGYAEDRTVTQGVQVTIRSVNIGGGNVGCNIVVADLIKESSISLGNPELPTELREQLANLHKAVAELSTKLPDDEALLAARDLKDLTDEVTSGSPRAAFWQRAANGLLDAAKRVADAGLPVVELVNKVVAILS